MAPKSIKSLPRPKAQASPVRTAIRTRPLPADFFDLADDPQLDDDWKFDDVLIQNELEGNGDDFSLHEEDDPADEESPNGEDSGDDDDPPTTFPRRRGAFQPDRVPVLPAHMAPAVDRLAADLTAETRGRERFELFDEADMLTAAEIFVRYRLPTLAVIRQTDRDARRMFVSDLRDIERLAFPDLQLILQLLSHFSPQLLKPRANAKDPPFEEAVLPEKLKAYRADLSQLGAFLKPNQLMANFISKELAKGKAQVPSYVPYIVADVSAVPWPVQSAEHTAAATAWKAKRQAKKVVNPQPVPFNAWLLYRLRFILTADLLGAWAEFGGLSAQLNFLSILLHLVTTESIAAALNYDSLIQTHLEELARSRANKTAGVVDFADLLSNEHARFKAQAIAQAKPAVPKSGAPKPDKEQPTGGKERKQKRIWLPRAEFLAKVAAEKEAKESSSSSAVKPAKSPSPSRKRSRRPSRSRTPKRRRSAQPKRQQQKQRQRRRD